MAKKPTKNAARSAAKGKKPAGKNAAAGKKRPSAPKPSQRAAKPKCHPDCTRRAPTVKGGAIVVSYKHLHRAIDELLGDLHFVTKKRGEVTAIQELIKILDGLRGRTECQDTMTAEF
jgi:hypothetical protein